MSKRTKQSGLSDFFHAPTKKICTTKNKSSTNNIQHSCSSSQESDDDNSNLAEYLAQKLDGKIIYLSTDGTNQQVVASSSSSPSSSSSWIIHVKGWFCTPSSERFDVEWNLHPTHRKKFQMFQRQVQETRWSQAWGRAIAYSGMKNEARNIQDSSMVPTLLEKINNEIMTDCPLLENGNAYNACLQNWYEPEDTMGLHSDDEKYLLHTHPIFSLSWGGSRRFVMRSKTSPKEKVEIWLEDGDLLIMGGTTQQTHKHELPKHRKKDPPTSNRINWTVRAVKDD